ncbi:hypothetical protein [Nocardia wallacei]|uniref:hypothetical protein n=1 Tax=Nocardia wallacei TaxID=480035 RepID=UPI0024588DCF|nr:hypothetical protein [Nocardia wallacei]
MTQEHDNAHSDQPDEYQSNSVEGQHFSPGDPAATTDPGHGRPQADGQQGQGTPEWVSLYGLTLPEGRHADGRDRLAIECRTAPGGADERARHELLVRAAAAPSVWEWEFVRRIRAEGAAIWACASVAGSVDRYAVQLDGAARPYTDTALGADLILPVLRGDWDICGHAQAEAAAEWRKQRRRTAFDRDRLWLSDPVVWTRMLADAEQFTRCLRTVPADERMVWSHAAARTAGVSAVWAGRMQPSLATSFTRLARVLGWSAGECVSPVPIVWDSRLSLGHVAFGLANLDSSLPDRPCEQLFLLLQLIGAVVLIGKAHRARGELARWRAIDDATGSLTEVCRELHARALRRD